jgi:hypothetical protein
MPVKTRAWVQLLKRFPAELRPENLLRQVAVGVTDDEVADCLLGFLRPRLADAVQEIKDFRQTHIRLERLLQRVAAAHEHQDAYFERLEEEIGDAAWNEEGPPIFQLSDLDQAELDWYEDELGRHRANCESILFLIRETEWVAGRRRIAVEDEPH